MTLVKRQNFVGVTGKSRTQYAFPQDNVAVLGGGFSQIEWGRNTSQSSRYGPGDSGSPMLLQRNITAYRLGYARVNAFNYGDVQPFTTYDPVGIATLPSDSNIMASGTTAIARTTPTSPIFSASQALGELRNDGVPAISGHEVWRDRTLTARNSGSEYLNYEFGWIPLAHDIRRFAYAVKNSHKVLQDFKKGSGKNIRVGYEFPNTPTRVVESGNRNGFMYMCGDNGHSTTGPLWFNSETNNRTWFKGAFSYHLPVGDSQAAKAARFESYANHLLGTRLTPEVVWNLAPWSWAADWFGNTGDIIHNISSVGHDGLVLRYGYIMNHNYKKTSYGVDAWGTTASVSTIVETKKRFPANPYTGFGASAALSATQSAILIALGLSHMR